jgi:hypothetical protein
MTQSSSDLQLKSSVVPEESVYLENRKGVFLPRFLLEEIPCLS